jgi:hypothetical protein
MWIKNNMFPGDGDGNYSHSNAFVLFISHVMEN